MSGIFDYTRMAATATRLIERFNQGLIVLTKLGSTTPPVNPWDPPVGTDPVAHTLKATAKGVSKEFIDGTTIVATDIEIIAAVFDAEPDPADVLTIDGKPVMVLRVIRLPAAGVVVAWKFVVRA